MNTLFYGDNLHVLRDHIPSESVDLIYLDPPFNSNRSYNVLFKDESGHMADAQITAFDDSWHWGQMAEDTYRELVEQGNPQVSGMISAMRGFIGSNQMMAYLVMMAARLVELHRVLKPTGSLYLHCDPTASHYLKIVMDTIFGNKQFRNEVIWHYSGWNAKLLNSFNSRHDVLLFYGKGDQQNFNSFSTPWENQEEYIKIRKQKVLIDNDNRKYVMSDAGGGKRVKRYLDEAISYGKPIDDVWDIDKINNSSLEKLGYQTQKPLKLIERIITASSNEGEIVLDPFSGCGSCISAAQNLGRQWIGIDITHLAIAMHKSRLKDAYGLEPGKDYRVIGEPEDLAGAHQLAHDDRYQFQWWALSLIAARPLGGSDDSKTGKKGSDRGIDGVIPFIDGQNKTGRVLVQVKSGHVNSSHIRDLKGVLEREKAEMGLFITLEEPTREMDKEAVISGVYESGVFELTSYPKIQIFSIRQLLDGTMPLLPIRGSAFKKASRITKDTAKQIKIEL